MTEKKKQAQQTFTAGSGYGGLVDFIYDEHIKVEGARVGKIINQYKRTASVFIQNEGATVLVRLPLHKPKTEWHNHVYEIVDKRVLKYTTTKPKRKPREAGKEKAIKRKNTHNRYPGGHKSEQ